MFCATRLELDTTLADESRSSVPMSTEYKTVRVTPETHDKLLEVQRVLKELQVSGLPEGMRQRFEVKASLAQIIDEALSMMMDSLKAKP